MTKTLPTTMQAITQETYGTSEQMQFTERPLPAIAADQVLVEVEAAGVDRGVWHVMTGKPYVIRVTPYGGLRGPKNPVPGSDVAGRVVSVGADVTGFAVGDEVFGIGSGTYAQYAVAKASKLVHKPANVSFEEAGAAAISGITALQALTKVGKLAAGQRVLIIGASGGVGSFAAQIAKTLGAEVTAVASGSKGDFVRSLGVEDVVDYARTDYLDGERQYDLIIDTGGNNPVRRLRKALTPRGTLVIVGGEGGGNIIGIGRQIGGKLLSLFVRQRITTFISAESTEDIQRIADLMAVGQVRTAVGDRYSLDQVPQALTDLEQGRVRGKAVIRIGSDNR